MLMAALISRSSSRPQAHRTVLTDRLIFSGKSCPQEEQVCDVLAGLTSTTILPASAALENSRSLKYPQPASMMLLDNLRFLTIPWMFKSSTAMKSYSWISLWTILFNTSWRCLDTCRWCLATACLAFSRFLPLGCLRERLRWSRRSFFCPARYHFGLANFSPSEVVTKEATPTSTPISLPVGGNACGSTSHVNMAYQPSALRMIRTAFGVEGKGLCQRTATRPTPCNRSLRPSILNPLPYSFKPKDEKRFLPLKRG